MYILIYRVRLRTCLDVAARDGAPDQRGPEQSLLREIRAQLLIFAIRDFIAASVDDKYSTGPFFRLICWLGWDQRIGGSRTMSSSRNSHAAPASTGVPRL